MFDSVIVLPASIGGEITLGDVLAILGYTLLVAVALVFGTGALAGVLSLPVLRRTGYGLLPVSKAPAEGGYSFRRASMYHVAFGAALTALFLPARTGVYVVALVAGRVRLLPDFWSFHATDAVLLVGLVAGAWAVCLGGHLSLALRRRDSGLALRSGASFLAYLAALVPAMFVIGELLVYAVPMVS